MCYLLGDDVTAVIFPVKDTQSVDVLLIIDGATFGTINLADIQTPHGSKNTFLSGIDLKDIATLNILKGAAGIKKYGEKAKAGVLIITTKSGKYTNENWRIRE